MVNVIILDIITRKISLAHDEIKAIISNWFYPYFTTNKKDNNHIP